MHIRVFGLSVLVWWNEGIRQKWQIRSEAKWFGSIQMRSGERKKRSTKNTNGKIELWIPEKLIEIPSDFAKRKWILFPIGPVHDRISGCAVSFVCIFSEHVQLACAFYTLSSGKPGLCVRGFEWIRMNGLKFETHEKTKPRS